MTARLAPAAHGEHRRHDNAPGISGGFCRRFDGALLDVCPHTACTR
jgi:hypothetical protein